MSLNGLGVGLSSPAILLGCALITSTTTDIPQAEVDSVRRNMELQDKVEICLAQSECRRGLEEYLKTFPK